MTGQQILELIAIGALGGAIGQGLRTIVGIKKANDVAAAEGKSLSEKGLDTSRLLFSLLVGAIAGGIGIFTLTGFDAKSLGNISPELFFGIVGIGYAGTDFIEGFVRTQLPKNVIAPAPVPAPPPAPAPAPASAPAPAPAPAANNTAQFVIATEAVTDTTDPIKESCNRLLQIPANAADCSKFAKAVAREFSVTLSGQANDIVDQLTAANGWTELGSDAQAGKKAAEAAAKGDLVIGARKETGNGHVVIVVKGTPLAHSKYPFAYWGKLNHPEQAGFNKTVNWAWDAAARDTVTYASRAVS